MCVFCLRRLLFFVWLFLVLGDILLCCEVVCKCGWKMVSRQGARVLFIYL